MILRDKQVDAYVLRGRQLVCRIGFRQVPRNVDKRTVHVFYTCECLAERCFWCYGGRVAARVRHHAMNKTESKLMQGVAILLMLFLHLFNSEVRVEELCSNYLTVGGTPLVYILTRAANPVPFFVLLSGYGLGFTYRAGRLTPRGRALSLLRLYFSYWLTLCVFAGMGCFLRPDKYPGTVWDVVGNVTSWSYSYNGETWFLLPYALVSLTSLWLFRLRDRLGVWVTLAVSLFLWVCTAFLISRYGDAYLYTHLAAYLPVKYVSFLFPFYLGSALQDWARRRGSLHFSLPGRGVWVPLALVALVALKCSTPHDLFNVFYAAAFILLLLNCPRPRWLDAFLVEMGRRSMLMWFVHSYFCYYLFKAFIFSPRQPLLVFLLELVCSYATAVVLGRVVKRVWGR